jgi:DNA-directed RNA polymerase specialized sigma24 family protein
MTTLLDQVPAAISRVQREIVLARFLGKLAVDQGVREVRQRIESMVAPVLGVEPIETEPAADSGEVIDPQPAATLALADYDHLPASDVVSMLAGLDPDERDAIEAYELQGRHRRTILGKLAQLRDA